MLITRRSDVLASDVPNFLCLGYRHAKLILCCGLIVLLNDQENKYFNGYLTILISEQIQNRVAKQY